MGVRRPAGLGVLTDLGYLIAGAFPVIASVAAPYLRWRYRNSGVTYNAISGAPGYSEPLQEALKRLTRIPSSVADVAAGTGSASRLILRRFPSINLIALDLSRAMLREWSSGGGALRVVADGRRLPLGQASVDLAVVQNAPPHFAELMRAVRPGGVVIFALSAAQWIPRVVRRSLIRRALPPGLRITAEISAGSGIAWVLDRSR